MKNNYLFILFSQVISISIAHAAATSPIPADLMYLNKPIDSLCFGSEAGSSVINLKRCGASLHSFTLKAMPTELSEKGYLGFDFEDTSVTPSSHGFSYYKYYPAANHQYWVYAINNGGGSGHFTSINRVERKNETTLLLNPIASGDRCNGGVQDVSEKANTLTYSLNLTAFDLIKLGDKNTKLKPYDDLAACATCCSAKSFYTLKAHAKPVLNYVELEKIAEVSEMSEQGTLASCFNEFYLSYTKAHSTKLTQEQLQAFVNQFKQACVK